MSWIIEEYIRRIPYIMEEPDIEDEVYNNAILILKCIEDLSNQGLLSDTEKDVLAAVMEGYNYTEVSKILHVDRQTVSLIFDKVTDRIAYVMGGEFTDASFLDRIQTLGDSISEKDVSQLFNRRGIIRDE
jgi:hypothetical protein